MNSTQNIQDTIRQNLWTKKIRTFCKALRMKRSKQAAKTRKQVKQKLRKTVESKRENTLKVLQIVFSFYKKYSS